MNLDFIYRGETQDLNPGTRKEAAGGVFVELPNGHTHYELGGPVSSSTGREAVVAFVHGFSVPYFIWDSAFEFFSGAGFRVLRYDLFGRGFSDRPRVSYNLDLFVRQLEDLLDALKLARVNLIGLSMGGAIASAFTARLPERVRKLALIAPIGTEPMPLSWMYQAAFLPGVSELILGLAGTDNMVKAVASDFFDPAHVEIFQEKYKVQMQYRGFKRAILSTLRNKTIAGFPEVYEKLGKLDLPVLLVWGRNDRTLPLEQSQPILELIPRAEFHVIENCGHIPHYEKSGEVNPILLKFLSQS